MEYSEVAHDAKLVATMNVHGIRRILTFNTDDFTRYDIEAVHPSSLMTQAAMERWRRRTFSQLNGCGRPNLQGPAFLERR